MNVEPLLDLVGDWKAFLSGEGNQPTEEFELHERTERLEQFPEPGSIPTELELSQYRYREIIVGPCRVIYRFDQNKVYILYVMRGERQLRKYLLDERAQESS